MQETRRMRLKMQQQLPHAGRRRTGNAWRESHRPLGEINARRPGPLLLRRGHASRAPGGPGVSRLMLEAAEDRRRRRRCSPTWPRALMRLESGGAVSLSRSARCGAPSLPFFSCASARASRGPNTRRSEHRPSERRPTEQPLPRRRRLRGHQPPASASVRDLASAAAPGVPRPDPRPPPPRVPRPCQLFCFPRGGSPAPFFRFSFSARVFNLFGFNFAAPRCRFSDWFVD